MNKLFLYLAYIICASLAVNAQSERLNNPANEITIPILPEDGYVFWADGRSITFFKDTDTASPYMVEAFANLWNRETEPTVWLWSNEACPQGYATQRAPNGFVYIPMEKDGNWVKVWHIDRPVWVLTGRTVVFKTTKLIAPEVADDYPYYIAQPTWNDTRINIYTRHGGKFNDMCSFYYKWGGMEGLFIGCKINNILVFPAFIPAKLEYYYAQNSAINEIQIIKPSATRHYYTLKYPLSVSTDYVLDIAKLPDEQITRLLQIANYSDELMIVYNSERARRSPSPMIWFKPSLWTGQSMSVPFQSGNYAHEAISISQDNRELSDAVEVAPSFPGGDAELMKWIGKNLKYPEYAAYKKIKGRVMLRFEILTDGSIGEIQVSKSVSQELDDEAIRLVKSMPKWNPATKGGVPVKGWYSLPINFNIL